MFARHVQAALLLWTFLNVTHALVIQSSALRGNATLPQGTATLPRNTEAASQPNQDTSNLARATKTTLRDLSSYSTGSLSATRTDSHAISKKYYHCGNECYYAVQTTQMVWFKPVTTTITISTAFVTIDPNTNNTSTTWAVNPDFKHNHTHYATQRATGFNEGGTRIAQLTLTDGIVGTTYTTDIAFPTEYVDYTHSYILDGMLPATTLKEGGKPSCTHVSSVNVPFPSHPPRLITYHGNRPMGSGDNGQDWDFILFADLDLQGSWYRKTFSSGYMETNVTGAGFLKGLNVFDACEPGTYAAHHGVMSSMQALISVTYASFLTASTTITLGTPTGTGIATDLHPHISIFFTPHIEISLDPVGSSAQPTELATAHGEFEPDTGHLPTSQSDGGSITASIVGGEGGQTGYPGQITPGSTVTILAPKSSSSTNPPGGVLSNVGPALASILHNRPSSSKLQVEFAPGPTTSFQSGGLASSAFVFEGHTLSPDSPITIGNGPSATVVQLETNSAGSSFLVIGGSSSLIPPAPPTPAAAPATTSLVIGFATITASAALEVIISGTTLTPGAQITLGSSSAIQFTIDGLGHTLLIEGKDTTTVTFPSGTAQETIVFDGVTVTETVATELGLSGTPLQPGSPVTQGGIIVSVTTDGASSTVVAVGTVSTTLDPSIFGSPSSTGSATNTGMMTGVSTTEAGTGLAVSHKPTGAACKGDKRGDLNKMMLALAAITLLLMYFS